MRGAIALLLLSSAACVGPEAQAESGDPVSLLDYSGVLFHEGVPAEEEDWSFAPFADLGAWHAYALAPTAQRHAVASFSGPFLHARGRWLSPRLAELELRDDSGAELRPEAETSRSLALPGSLRHEAKVAGLEVRVSLWFDSADTAVVRARLRNPGPAPRRLRAIWKGVTFPGVTLVPAAGGSLVIDSPEGDSIRIESDQAVSSAEVSGLGYRLPLVELLEIPSRSSIDLTLAVNLTMAGEPAAESARWIESPARVEASARSNRERWSGYLGRIDRGRSPTDPLQTLAVKAVMTLIDNWRGPAGRMRHDALFPSSNVAYFNGFWAWDSWKHAVGLARFAPEIAASQLRAMFDHQNEGGMIADVVYLDADEDNWRDTKPPLAGWALEIVHQTTGDLSLVADLYPKLVAYHRFWYRDRDHDADGLCEYGSTDGTLVAARWESGMDNAVRFDETKMLRNGDGAWSMSQEAVDLNSYLYREKLALSRLAEAQGLSAEAVRWAAEADELGATIRRSMFDSTTGWFYDLLIDGSGRVPVQGPEGWIPLWAGLASPEQAARVRTTLLDPAKFRTHVPFPTVARDDPGFSDGYWRGLVWLDQAYFAIEALRRYGYREDAAALSRQLLANLAGATAPGVPLRENYHPLTGEGRNVRHFSWTAVHLLLLALDLDSPPPTELSKRMGGLSFQRDDGDGLLHGPQGALPIHNGGELAVVYAFLFLFIASRGAGTWTLGAKKR